jgi:hypothetical protein
MLRIRDDFITDYGSFHKKVYNCSQSFPNDLNQCCGSGMFYPGSGSLNFSSRIWVKNHLIPDPTVHKKRDENKTNLFLAPYGFRYKFD